MSQHPPEGSPEPAPEPFQETSESPPQRRRILLKLFLSFCVFSVVAFSLLSWYVTTDSFQQKVRHRVIASAEKLTGGRVELGELHTIPFRLRVDARNLTIHGREASDQIPFAHVDRVQAEMKIISLFSTTVGLHSLELDHPVVHIIDYPDGTTNAPVPQTALSSSSSDSSDRGPIEQLISLAVSHIEVRSGEFLWQDKKVPFDFAARDLTLLLNRSLLRRQYEAHIVAGSVATRYQDYPSFEWRADVALVLARGRADISSLTVTSGKSEFHFAGRLRDFHNPQVTGDYHGVADLGELASLARQAQVHKGTAQLEGKGSWSPQAFSTQGTVQAKDLDWSNNKLSMRNGRINADFAVTPDRFRISSIKANLLGGDLSGDADVTNWQSSLQSSLEPSPNSKQRRVVGRVAAGSLQRGSLHLQLAGFPLLPALQFMSSKKLPLDQLALAGSANGTVEMLWVGSIRDAETRLKIGVAPPLKPVAGGIPVSGQIDGVYRGSRDELEMSQLHLTTPSSEISASGNLAATSALRFSFSSHNLKEWTPLLQAAYGSPNLPFAIHGWASLAGNASGKLSAFSVNGNLEVYDFDTTLPATKRAPSQVLHWDALTTAVQYSSNHFSARNGSLIHGRTTAHFETSAELERGGLHENNPFTLHFDLRNLNVLEFAQLAGVAQTRAGTVAGNLDLSATLSGTLANPHGDGHLELHNGAAYGVASPLLMSDLRLSGGALQFNNIEASVYGALLSGSASIGIFGTEWSKNDIRLNLAGRNLDLSRLPHFQSSLFSADGVADFTVHVSGTPDQPELEAHLHVKDLAFDKERSGDFFLDAITHGKQLELKAHSDFDKADLNLAGNVDLDNDHGFPADLNLAFHNLDINSLLLIYWPGKITGKSPLEGTLHVRGPLRNPRDLIASAELQSLSVEVEHVQIHNVGPIRFEVANQALLVENLHLAGSGTDFTAHGRANLTGTQQLDLRLEGTVN
ncbi:MAG: hypothetical protein WBQ39_09050, partial [Terriglobales bacterium]